MEIDVTGGFILGIMAGIFAGSFALPMKFTKKWQWENTWIIWSVCSLLIIPWTIAFITVPDLFSVFAATTLRAKLLVFLFGFGWGIGGVTFGLGLEIVGLALGNAIMMGLINALGSILPLVIFHPENLLEPVGLWIIAGVAVIVSGIVICSIAGFMKEKALSKLDDLTVGIPSTKKPFAVGLAICVFSGILSPMLNFAFVYGDELRENAMELGAASINASNAIWSIALLGGLVVNVGYCGYRLTKNKTWKLFRAPGSKSHWIYSFLMGLMWALGIAIYGMSASKLGELGSSLGWPIYIGMAIIAGNIMGLFAGEWKGSGAKPVGVNSCGIVLIIVGLACIGRASAL